MLCALRCATMPAVGNEQILRSDMAFLASQMFYQVLYQTDLGSSESQVFIDESVRHYCDFLNSNGYFSQHCKAGYVRYGAPIDPKLMVLKNLTSSQRQYEASASSQGKVKPSSCYFFKAPDMSKPYIKAEIEIIS